MELDDDIRGFIAETGRIFGPGYSALPIEGQRRVYAEWCRAFAAPGVADVGVDEIGIERPSGVRGTLRALLQRPAGVSADTLLPVVIYYHGGGWIMGSPETHAGITAALARRAGVAVLSVDYRLAPEHPFPAAFDDAYAALAWVARQGRASGLDGALVALAGDSAGGNLAAAVAIAARDRGGPPVKFQLLYYPFLKARRRETALDHPEAGTEAGMAAYLAAYAGGADVADNPYAMPRAERNLAGLPPAFIADAEIDILREDAADYAAALRAAGVAVAYRRAPGLTHSFLRCIHFSRAAHEVFEASAAALAQVFARAGHARDGAGA